MTRSDIQQIIDEDINPMLESHGGYITIRAFDEEKKSLKLEMGGGCQGCASSRLTLKIGVQNHLREVFPEIEEIEDVTDHLMGTNPYYT